MKVLITTDWYKPAINGVVTSVVNLAKGLTSLGHEVKILTLSGSIHSYKEDNVVYIGSVSVGLVYPNARLKMALTHQLVNELIEWKPDVIHSQCEFSTFFMAKKIAQTCNSPLVHTYHTVYEDFTHYFSPSRRLGRNMVSILSRKILSHTNAVIVPTDKIAYLLRNYGVKQPVFSVATGLDLPHFFKEEDPSDIMALKNRFGISPDDFVFVYAGRLAKEKNIEELFHLLKDILADDIKFLVVGDGPYRETLIQRSRELGLDKNIIFTGMVVPEEIALFYKAGDVFLSASQSEAQGLTYIEAMACSLPLLCKNDPCLDSVIDNGVDGFVYNSPEDFVDIATSLLNDPQRREQIGKAASEKILKQFSAEAFAEKISSIYSSCCS